MNPTEEQKNEATEWQRLRQNIQQTQETAGELFPNETWDSTDKLKLKYEQLPGNLEGIKIARSRFPVNKSQEKELIKELLSAKVLKNKGASVYLIPKMKRPDGSGEMPGPDAIVNGKLFEFKTITGRIGKVEKHFRDSRKQGGNVYICVVDPKITRNDVIRKLSGIINSNDYTGGFKGDVVFTIGTEKYEKTYFLKIKDLKR